MHERVDRLLAEHADDDKTTFLGAQFDAGLARMDYPVGHGGLDAEPAAAGDRRRARSRRPGAATRGSATPWASACAARRSSPAAREEQQERFLRPIFTAEEIWCQLFSEPGAGSDVAGLVDPRRARRRRVDRERLEDLDVAGPPVALRAAARPHRPRRARSTRASPRSSSTCTQPGVEVRRIRSMAGASGFNEVFFTDVRRARRDARRRDRRGLARRPTPR